MNQKKNIMEDSLNMIYNLNLTHIFIAKCYKEFNELEMFLNNVSSQLQVLGMNSFTRVTCMLIDGNESLKNIYFIWVFSSLKYEESYDEDLEAIVYHERFNRFIALFWCKQQWLFRIYSEINIFGDENVVAFSICCSRRFLEKNRFSGEALVGFGKDNENDDESFNDDIGRNLM